VSDRVRVVVHELGHALVGRRLGQPVRLLVTTLDVGFTWSGPPPAGDRLSSIASKITAAMAGDDAVLVLGDRLSAFGEPSVDDIDELLASVSPDEVERELFRRFCAARSWRFATECAPLIEALIPWALEHPAATGDELEAAIAALPGQKGT
jgi:hypothetical protein